MKPKTFAKMTSGLLYEHRFGPYFVEPVIAGLEEKTNRPFVCATDLIGCITEADDFAVAGKKNLSDSYLENTSLHLE